MKWFGLMLCSLVVHATSAGAQTPAAKPADTATAVADTPSEAPVDPTTSGVSLRRIRLELAIKPETKTSGLKIQEAIQVVGVAPKIQLWDPETAKLATGPVPWGAPTHKDFIDLNTPQEFKNYPMDLNALMMWLMQHLGDKTAKAEAKKTE